MPCSLHGIGCCCPGDSMGKTLWKRCRHIPCSLSPLLHGFLPIFLPWISTQGTGGPSPWWHHCTLNRSSVQVVATSWESAHPTVTSSYCFQVKDTARGEGDRDGDEWLNGEREEEMKRQETQRRRAFVNIILETHTVDTQLNNMNRRENDTNTTDKKQYSTYCMKSLITQYQISVLAQALQLVLISELPVCSSPILQTRTVWMVRLNHTSIYDQIL